MRLLIVGLSLFLLSNPARSDESSSEANDQASATTQGNGIADGRAAGGAAFADFDSLMELIQTTIAPDSWDALGGSGTMSPYPQGIWVDPQGIVRQCDPAADETALASLRASLMTAPERGDGAAPQPGNESNLWRRPSARRVVSLGRLHQQVIQQVTAGLPLDSAMQNTAGLSRIEFVVLTSDDVWIVGPVGGFKNRQGWWCDRQTGRVPIPYDAWTYTFAAADTGRPIGCTIDPTPKGLASAGEVASKINAGEVPRHQAAEWMSQALGLQNVSVFGMPGDTPLGYRMVEADRHMKELALGIAPMPNGVPNYLDQVDRYIKDGVPSDLLLRMWFTANPITAKSDSGRQTFSLTGRPVKLSGENQLAQKDGTRGNLVRDPRLQDFIENFNDNWSAIAQEYPIHGSIESLFTAASVAAIMKQSGNETASHLLASVPQFNPHEQVVMATPRQVPSVAVMHTKRIDKTRHHVLIASGGVSVDPGKLIAKSIDRDPSLTDGVIDQDNEPNVIQKWWWD